MSTRIISLRLSEHAIGLADDLARTHGLSRSKLIEFLVERASAEDARRQDKAYLQQKADLPFHWKDGER